MFWAKWSDALAEAGFSANKWNRQLDKTALLERFIKIVRERGAIPSDSEILLMRRTDDSVPHPKTLRNHFEGRYGLVAALRSYCLERRGFEDVLEVLPEDTERPIRPNVQPAEGWVYLLRSGQHYKIGRSDQLETRVKKSALRCRKKRH